MFEQIFELLEERLKGFRAAVVVSSDGIEIEAKVKEELSHEVLSAELNSILQHLERLNEDVSLGSYEEVIIKTNKENVCLVKVSSEAFILLITDKNETTGKAIYEVQRLIPEFSKILS
ncbi:MAG: roadblock/LC7 domain-containing protein [Acidobacteria bacterium]|nr:roadblock/LC7 domain-containing protein [Acidobacteriota bacterium]